MQNHIEKRYPVMEHFHTLQGEGFWTGNAAYFIRLGGCDVGCTWCDVKESWDIEKHPFYEVSEISAWLSKQRVPIAVVTGGEPTMHSLEELTTTIQSLNIRTHIETSGTHPLSGSWDWITFSPKRFKKPLEEYYAAAHELKIVISHKNDFRWGLEHASKLNKKAHLYLQPEWEHRKDIEPLCIEFIKEHPIWKLSLQTHKYLGID